LKLAGMENIKKETKKKAPGKKLHARDNIGSESL
jgi:hypothetical protein